MNQITLHPNVYSSTGSQEGLVDLLKRIWVDEHNAGEGILFIISGFANYNGGINFYDAIKKHVERGGEAKVILSGSTNSRLSSKQVVRELLRCGADVSIVNRKRLLHAKCYGVINSGGETIIITSGNFTGPGMTQNGELSVLLDNATASAMGFSWQKMYADLVGQNWNFYKPELSNLTAPAWSLLYDEKTEDTNPIEVEKELISIVVILGHADTVRINAEKGTNAGKGSQYFWLSKDSYSFFPPLDIKNEKGDKSTYSADINLKYVELDLVAKARVTFESGNNSDFRLGTGKYRYTKLAQREDLAVVSRIGEYDYQVRIFKKDSAGYNLLIPYAITDIGNEGKRYGYLSNQELEQLLSVKI